MHSLDDDGGGGVVREECGLWLVGVGPGDLDLMTVAAIDRVKSCRHRFLEGYTALLPDGASEALTAAVGQYTRIMRNDVENPDRLLELAATDSVALMVVGDPLQATTHVDLQLRALERGVRCEIIHGISVTTIVTGAVGLQSYRFGRVVTLAYPYGDYLATSPIELVAENRAAGLHSLVLLDLDPTGMGVGEQMPMSPAVAVDVIRRSADSLGLDITSWRVVLCSDMGRGSQRMRYGRLSEIAAIEGGLIHCLVIPGRLDELEKRALARWQL